MFDLSKRATLGLYVMVQLARSSRQQHTNEELARLLGASTNHLAKVMQAFARKGWVVGTRGSGGGYRLVVDPKSITMADVIAVFEGEPNLETCALSRHGPCGITEDCSVKNVVREIEEQAYFTLSSVSVHLLAFPKGSQPPQHIPRPALALAPNHA